MTLLHGDVHLDNVAFLDQSAAAPVLFDWQCVAKGQGVVDHALFLTTGSPMLGEPARAHSSSGTTDDWSPLGNRRS